MKADLSALFARHYDRLVGAPAVDEPDPVAFCRRELTLHPWREQRAFLRTVAAGGREPLNRIVAWGTGHGVGKTNAGAALVCWWLAYLGSGSMVVTSAPTNRQVELLLWREVNRLWPRSPRLLKLGRPRRKYIRIAPNWVAEGFSTDDPERFQGIHAPKLRVLIDEANGFPESLFQAIDACLTGQNSQLVMIGNCLDPQGRFYNSFSDESVAFLRCSSREHPNVRRSRELIPGAVTAQWISSFEDQYGAASPISQARIDAVFPEDVNEGLLSKADIEAAERLDPAKLRTLSPAVYALDVARFGKCLNVLTKLSGQRLDSQESWGKTSLTRTADRVYDRWRDSMAECIVVDDDGVGGGVTDILRDKGAPVIAFNGGLPPEENQHLEPEQQRYADRITEAYWSVRELTRNGVLSLRGLHPLAAQQLRLRQYGMVRGHLLKLESKQDFCTRTGLPSPDYADSLAMACHEMMLRWHAALAEAE